MAGGLLTIACLSTASATAQVAAPSVDRAPSNVDVPTVERRDPLLVQFAYTGDILSSVAGGT
ncbi:hypothetical protein ASE70_11110 [Sphingomonas sp. Leaf22]|uniref:hypothetical protein n=1 Tax=Sphingomonas sp. Leaf22 TaxID=1735687 RepID=UPI0007008497|nr:hypothetical protein [Sphingomonas sp. Leaf22]KQM94345.1 hypothetical protein ASE70_11110 [Sphingomonas sp. Leaf22]